MFKLPHNCTHFTASKVMLKILQLGFNSMWTENLQMYKLSLEKAEERKKKKKKEKSEESEIKLPTSLDHRKSKRISKNIYSCFTDYTFDCVDHNKLWKNLKRDENTRPPHLSPEKPVCRSRSNRTLHGATDWFKIGKGEHQGYIFSPCLFNLHAEHIVQNAGLDEYQTGIQIAGRNINNLRYADDNTLLAENKEELESLLMKFKEESEKAGLKLKIQKTKNTASSPITSWQIDG